MFMFLLLDVIIPPQLAGNRFTSFFLMQLTEYCTYNAFSPEFRVTNCKSKGYELNWVHSFNRDKGYYLYDTCKRVKFQKP